VFFFPLWKIAVVPICYFCLPQICSLPSIPTLNSTNRSFFLTFGEFSSSIYGLHSLPCHPHTNDSTVRGKVTHAGQVHVSITQSADNILGNTLEVQGLFSDINIDSLREKVFTS
jgi:hypothetical protein